MPRTKRINNRMLSVLEYIKNYTNDNGYPPTYREIGYEIGISSTSLVKYYIDRLVENRMINNNGNIRGLYTEDESIPTKKKIMTQISSPKRIRSRKLFVTVSANTYFNGCAYCGSKDIQHIDHFLPVKLGGVDSFYNLLPTCKECNLKKSGKEPVSWVIDNFGVEKLIEIIGFLHSVYYKEP